jgi:hypothetical protein
MGGIPQWKTYPSTNPEDTNWKRWTYTETPVFIKGLTRVDEGSRHEGRMLNAQNPSAMSPTKSEVIAYQNLTISG